ncbi:hypothetical protein GGR58DRAFT_461287, partial [Xylaria digitata]
MLLDRLHGLGAVISQICEIAGTPGLSLGIPHHGQVIQQAKFGLRDVKARLSVLVDEGKLSWTTQFSAGVSA